MMDRVPADVFEAGEIGHYRLPGAVLSIASSSEPIKSHLAVMFQQCPTTSRPADLLLCGRAAFGSEIEGLLPDWVKAGLPDVLPSKFPSMMFGSDSESGCAVVASGRSFYAWQSNAGNRIDLLCERVDEPAPPVIQPVLNPILRDALALRGEILLHSALVQNERGKGLLFIAPSGGGKTTTAISVVRSGGRLVADDLVSLHTEGGRAIGRGIPKVLNLRPPTLEYFSELDNHPDAVIRPTGDRRTNLEPSAVYGESCLVESLEVDAIYLPTFSKAGPRVREIDAVEGMKALIQAHAFSQSQKILSESVVAIAEFLGKSPIFELETGADPAELGSWLNQQ